MAAIDTVLREDSFSGELLAALGEDPFDVGHGATGAIALAVGQLRAAAKAAAEGAGSPQPAAYELKVGTDGGKFAVVFAALPA